jgi:polyisoprenoid-binding protein YceI
MIALSRTKLAVPLALALVAFAGVAEAKLARTNDKADVRFFASGPGGLKIEGKTSTLNLVDDGQLVKIFVPLNTLDTSIDLRNKHMREKYLETEKFPNAELQVARSALKIPAKGTSTSGEAQGTLTIHGASKPATFKYEAKADGGGIDVTGSMHVNMKDFGITQPSYLGVSVKTDVDITVHFRATDG